MSCEIGFEPTPMKDLMNRNIESLQHPKSCIFSGTFSSWMSERVNCSRQQRERERDKREISNNSQYLNVNEPIKLALFVSYHGFSRLIRMMFYRSTNILVAFYYSLSIYLSFSIVCPSSPGSLMPGPFLFLDKSVSFA